MRLTGLRSIDVLTGRSRASGALCDLSASHYVVPQEKINGPRRDRKRDGERVRLFLKAEE